MTANSAEPFTFFPVTAIRPISLKVVVGLLPLAPA